MAILWCWWRWHYIGLRIVWHKIRQRHVQPFIFWCMLMSQRLMWRQFWLTFQLIRMLFCTGTTPRWWVRRATQISKDKQTDCIRCILLLRKCSTKFLFYFHRPYNGDLGGQCCGGGTAATKAEWSQSKIQLINIIFADYQHLSVDLFSDAI